MKRRDLIWHMAATCGLTVPQARRAVDTMTDAIAGQLLAGQTVTIRRFGRFEAGQDGKVIFVPAFRPNHSPA